MLLAHKNYLINCERLEEDTIVKLRYGETKALKGDYVCTNQFGDKQVLAASYVEEMYVPVHKKKKIKRIVDYESIAKAYSEGLSNQEEDQEYIDEMKRIVNINK